MKLQVEILCDKCDKKVLSIKNDTYRFECKFTLICETCAEKLKKENELKLKSLLEQRKEYVAPPKRSIPKEGKDFTILTESHGSHICEYSAGGIDCTLKATHWIIELEAYTCKEHFEKWSKGWIPV